MYQRQRRLGSIKSALILTARFWKYCLSKYCLLLKHSTRVTRCFPWTLMEIYSVVQNCIMESLRINFHRGNANHSTKYSESLFWLSDSWAGAETLASVPPLLQYWIRIKKLNINTWLACSRSKSDIRKYIFWSARWSIVSDSGRVTDTPRIWAQKLIHSRLYQY